MPPVITGANFTPGSRYSFVSGEQVKKLKESTIEEYRARYPKSGETTTIDLQPGSELHDMIRNELLQRAFEARLELSQRFDSWQKLDQVLTAYIPADDYEKNIQLNDPRKPVSIVIPQSYADRETFLTYLWASLLEDPIYRYEGVGPEDIKGGILMEHVMNHQARKFKHMLAIDAAFSDAITYGFGKVWLGWDSVQGFRSRRIQGTQFDDEGNEIEGTTERVSERVTLFEGNNLRVCDPYSTLDDPTMAAEDHQDGEFSGYVDTSTYMNLLEQEITNPDLFNVRYLERVALDGRSFLSRDLKTGREDKKGGATRGARPKSKTRPIDLIIMQVQLIPSEWSTQDGSQALGDSDSPEKWEFMLAGDAVLISAKRLDYDHGSFTSAKVAPNGDMHQAHPVSLLEIGYPLAHSINWLWNAHIANKRKTVNNIFVLNPKLINEFDVDNVSQSGGKIRMRQAGWNIGKWQDHIGQLPIADVTQRNLQDIEYLRDIDSDSLGTVDQAKGIVRPRGERISATEISGARSSALSRLERLSRKSAVQFIQDLATMGASHTKQFMSEATYVKVVGELEKQLREVYDVEVNKGRVEVKPSDIDVNYDIVANDGSIPSMQGDPQVMSQLMAQALQIPQLMTRIKWTTAFLQTARAAGFKNVNEWLATSRQEIQENEEVLRQVEAGNLVPANENGGV